MRALLLLSLAGCASSAIVSVTPEDVALLATIPPEARPRVAVHPFEVKKLGCGCDTEEVGREFGTLLETSLLETGRFLVLERRRLAAALEEQDLGTTGRVRPGTAPAVGEIEGAEWVVLGTVTDFMHRKAAIGIGALVDDLFGGIGYREAHVAVDVRVVEVATGRVVFGAAAEATPTETGLHGFGVGEHVEIGAMAFYRTPLGSAVRAAMGKVARLLALRAVRWGAGEAGGPAEAGEEEAGWAR